MGNLCYWLNYFCACLSFGGKTAILMVSLREASAECQTLLTLTIPSATRASVIRELNMTTATATGTPQKQ